MSQEEQEVTKGVTNGQQNAEVPATDSKPVVSRLKNGQFAPGYVQNPAGRGKGVKNHSTRVREALLAQVGRGALRRFGNRLNKGSSRRDFSKAMDHVIALLGPSKPLIDIDNSKHTHMTVILDGTKEPARGSEQSAEE